MNFADFLRPMPAVVNRLGSGVQGIHNDRSSLRRLSSWSRVLNDWKKPNNVCSRLLVLLEIALVGLWFLNRYLRQLTHRFSFHR